MDFYITINKLLKILIDSIVFILVLLLVFVFLLKSIHVVFTGFILLFRVIKMIDIILVVNDACVIAVTYKNISNAFHNIYQLQAYTIYSKANKRTI